MDSKQTGTKRFRLLGKKTAVPRGPPRVAMEIIVCVPSRGWERVQVDGTGHLRAGERRTGMKRRGRKRKTGDDGKDDLQLRRGGREGLQRGAD
ncbi:hypothetical protein AAFF_G00434140 [Aldrovandia affinis]|uniref:Uncharacterized protein n=1 Tax=Aldrovandia affinis TaxID=143900 RepID=A0AAD7WIC1_9TELE|nr:hypothetical protein AAFF_G00434140 [Aldrovandia affinis]